MPAPTPPASAPPPGRSAGSSTGPDPSGARPRTAARRILADRPVVDAHHDALQRALDLGHDLGERTDGQFDLERARAGGVGASVFACWVDGHYALHRGPAGAAARAHGLMDALEALCARHPEQVRWVRTRAELAAARTDRVHAALCGIEGGHAIEESLDELDRFADRGLRCMTLVWNNHLSWIRSCQPNAAAGVPAGLSAFGRDVVRHMEERGVVVDLSHAGERALFDVLDAATKPVLASHSGCRALFDHPRNLTDEQLRAIATNGGVLGVVFHPGFLDERARAEQMRVRRTDAYRAANGANHTARDLAQQTAMQALAAPFDVARVVDHVEHAVEVMGIEHVGIGSDFDGIEHRPAGLEDVSGYGVLVDALLARGFTADDVRAVLGRNVRRVFDAVLPAGR